MAALESMSERYRGFCRVDWVGGTTDMWPLYCHMSQARVINMAIPVTMNVDISLEQSEKFSVEIFSEDLRKKSTHNNLEAMNKDILKTTKQNPLRWLHRVAARAFEIAN